MNTSNNTPPRRLLFLISRFLDGGIDIVLVSYLNHLAQRSDVRVTLTIAVDMGNYEVFLSMLDSKIEVTHCVRQCFLTAMPRRRAMKRLSGGLKIFDEVAVNPIRKYIISRKINKLCAKADVVIDFDCHAYAYLRNVKAKKIAFFHFSFAKHFEQYPNKVRRVSKGLMIYDNIVTICNAMFEEGKRFFPSLSDKFVTIYNAYDRDALLGKAGMPSDVEPPHTPYIVAVERLEETQKDITTLLKAYAVYGQTANNALPLYIVGKGNSEERLKALANKLGIAHVVHFVGFVENALPWIKQAKLLVHSAKFEGLPTVLIEGLMLGKCMVSTNCPTGPKEILMDGEAGILVPVGDVTKLAEAIGETLSNTALHSELSRKATEVSTRFTYTQTDKLFLPLIGLNSN